MNSTNRIGPHRDSKWDPTTNEVEYFRIGRGSIVDYQVQLRWSVLFGDVEIISGKPVVPFLREAAREVGGVIAGIKDATAEIVRDQDS
ncbi:hypothetical protein [Bradyrhizobium sp. AZCC 2230]|uniref:hypothetical protein n=1 Tax=Bradyrhizobium sp. AZCC 2230 TaxID=3117021 RepID=UPI002FF39FE2